MIKMSNDSLAELLRKTLDESEFEKELGGWAYILGVSVEEIGQWIAGKKLPRPDCLWIIFDITETRTGFSLDVHSLWDELRKRSLREITSAPIPAYLSTFQGTLEEYTNLSGVEAFVEELKEKYFQKEN